MTNEELREAEVLRRIGYRLRDLRNQRGLNLRDLSELTGISPGYLSQLENGKAVPSLQVMLKLSDTFNKNMNYFFEKKSRKQQYIYFPKENHVSLQGQNGSKEIRILSPGEQLEIEPIHVSLKPGEGGEFSLTTHEGWEFVYVIQGEVTLHLGDQIVIIRQGDSICYNSMIPHTSVNQSGEVAIGIWIGFKRNPL